MFRLLLVAAAMLAAPRAAEAQAPLDIGAPVRALAQDVDGNIWIGTEQGLVRFDGASATTYTPAETEMLDSASILSLLADPDGTVWIGTAAGLTSFRDGRWRKFGKVHPAVGEEPIAAVVRLGSRLWVSPESGLHQWTNGFDYAAHGEQIEGIDAIAGEGDEHPWVAAGGTLYRWNHEPGRVARFEQPSRVHVLLASRGMLWVGSEGGLYRGGSGGFTRVTGDDVTALHADHTGMIWIGTRGGTLLRVPSAGGAPEAIPFDRGAQLRAIRSILAARDGTLWIGGDGGLARLPGAAPVERTPPARTAVRPTIQVMALDGIPRRPDGDGVLRYTPASGRAVLAVRYNPGTPNEAATMFYSYRLEGVDGEWVNAEHRTAAQYPRLAPGTYRFHVRVREVDTEWSPVTTAAIVIRPRFFETPWFRVVTGLSIALLFAGALFIRALRARARERELSVLVADRTQALQAAKRALELSNETLERRVEEGIGALRESERMAAYGHLVAGVAHEVRQPLFAVSTVSYVLADKLRDKAELAPQLDLLSREVKRMAAMMDELLDFARPPALLTAPTDVGALLDEAIETFRAEGDPGAPAVTASCRPDVPRLTVDHGRMLQVLVNLLQNARRHAEGATRITLAARVDGGEAILSVENDGAGISPEILPHVFEPFFSGGRGTGLGLPIARRIVEMHGGAITVSSGDGVTRFDIRLPINAAG